MITWMKLEGITLSRINQVEKDKYCVISLMCGLLKKKKNQTYRNRGEPWLPGSETLGRCGAAGLKVPTQL